MKWFSRSEAAPTYAGAAHVHLFGRQSVPAPLRRVTLESVLAGDTCSPIGLADFEAYLSFVENALPNLQFVVWYQCYRERFLALPDVLQALSPANVSSDSHPSTPDASECARDTTFASDASTLDDYISVASASPRKASFFPPGLLAPFSAAPTIARAQQPFRPEIARIVATFLAPSAPKALRLPQPQRTGLVLALGSSTHPDVLTPAYDAALAALRGALPRFLAQSVVATNRPKQLFWYALGALWVSLGLAIFLGTLLGAPHGPVHLSEWGLRGVRLAALPLVYYGSSVLFMAAQGHCAKVTKRGHTQLRPWELEAASEDTRTWWAGLTGVAEAIADEDETLADDLAEAEDGLFRVKSESEASAEIPVPLTLRARRRARQVRDQLLSELSSLELPSILKKPALTAPTSPVVISFTRTTTVAIDVDSSTPPPPKALAIDVQRTQALESFPEITFSADDTTLADHGSTGAYAKTTPPPSPGLPSGRFVLRRPLTVFGPEKVVLDPRIRAAHKRVKLFTVTLALIPSAIFVVICLAVPALR